MRLIDADALKEKKFPDREISGYGEGTAYRCGWNDAIEAICENEPTIDAVEVVRCKDCKYKYMYKSVWECPYGLMITADGYCNYGERKEGE